MKKILIILFFILSFSGAANAAKVENIESKDGLKIWAIQDKSNPLISVKICFSGAGSAYDPEEKEGLSTFVASMLDEGAAGIDGLTFRKEMAEKAIYISFSNDKDNFYISMKTLSENLEEAIKYLGLAITKADFNKESVELIREQLITILAKNEEDPDFIANRKWYQVAFAGHPYSKSELGDKNSLGSISKKDMKEFVRNNFTRDKIYISAVGDFDNVKLLELLDRYLFSMPDEGRKIVLSETSVREDNIQENIHMDVSQSIAWFGQKGVKQSDPNFYTAYVLNYILGGGSFESRLMKEVREERGLAYSVYTDIDSLEYSAILSGTVASKNEKIEETIEIIKEQFKKIKTNGVSQEEVDAAKKQLTGSFPLKLDSNDKLANFLIVMQVKNLGIDFLEERNNLINNVRTSEINSLARHLITPKDLIFVVVGN